MTDRPRVFYVQNTRRTDRRTGELTLKHDLTSAEEFGDLVQLLSPTARPDSAGVVRELREKLRGIERRDYLLLVGNPALIGYAAAIAADHLGGHLRLLQWGNDRYRVLTEQLWEDET